MRFINVSSIILICILFFAGCQGIETLNSAQTIIPPENNRISIQGTWKIKDYKRMSDLQEENDAVAGSEELLGEIALFAHDWAVVVDESCTEAQYQVRRVNAVDYFLFHHNTDVQELGVENEMIEIISVTSNGVLFFDILKMDDDTAIIYMDKCFYWLEKVSDNIERSRNEYGTGTNKEDVNRYEEEKIVRSGVFLGLRTTIGPGDDGYGNRSAYRTIWISSNNRRIESVLETSNLFIPRRSGFWKLDVGTRRIGGFLQDYFDLSPVDSMGVSPGESGNAGELLSFVGKNLKKNILFISDDYIAIEYSETAKDEIREPDKYMVLPLDDANSQKGIKISNFADEGMEDIFHKSAQSFLVSKGRKMTGDLRESAGEENFTVARRNGHWILRGRLNIDGIDEDFNIGLMPAGKLLNYDKLHVSWDDIKGKIPMALDAYTSPAKDILIAVTGNFLMVYTIEDGRISEKPIKKIGIKKGETVIMAEWATGDYVARWEKGFNQINPFVVNE
ncbi:MAG TPA: hypothetical protein VFD89_05650 [Clostridia bacterium]|nr:hypothetical protein [Clostridia bacterium]